MIYGSIMLELATIGMEWAHATITSGITAISISSIYSAVMLGLAAVGIYCMYMSINTWLNHGRKVGFAFPLFGVLGLILISGYNAACAFFVMQPIAVTIIALGMIFTLVDCWCVYIQTNWILRSLKE